MAVCRPAAQRWSVAARDATAACQRGERALLFAYEQSAAQIIRNMQSINIDLAKWVEKGAAADPRLAPHTVWA